VIAGGAPAAGASGEGGAGKRSLRRALVALCISEITSWGVLYYAFPVVLEPLTEDTGWSAETALSAFSTGLLVSAVSAVPVGRLLDRYGPRPLMTSGSVLGVAALLAVAAAPTLPWFFAAWVGVGLAQSMLLYPPAFAALTGWYGPRRVRAITTLSLVAGLASTVFAPPTAILVTELGWRTTYVALAGLLGVVTLPLHAVFLTPAWPAGKVRSHRPRPTPAIGAVARSRPFLLLVAAMTLAAFGLYGATINLVPLLTSRGIGNTLAATVLGLIGAGQVLGRLGYPALTRRTAAPTRTIAILTIAAVTIALLGALPGPAAALVAAAVCAGGAGGAYTLLQATAVSDRWGTRRYATLNGIALAPAIAARAIAPAATALLADRLGSYPNAFYLLAALILAGAATAWGTAAPPPRAPAS
jgi:MFS family permease